MPDADETKLIREATEIFLRLRDDPKNPDRQRDRDRFLDRGDAERAAYAKMMRAWRITETRRPPTRSILPFILLAALLSGAVYLGFDPIRIALYADVSTRYLVKETQLASGDTVQLDAGTALMDETNNSTRNVTVMQGTAFFDVTPDGRDFVVAVGDAKVDVTGTSFEVALLGDGGRVTVTKGSVEVTLQGQAWRLEPGEQVRWTDNGPAQVSAVALDASASWRRDQLVAHTLTVAEIAEILGRRVPGGVIVLGTPLAETPIVGTFDLADPEGSLALLAELTGATSRKIPGLGTLLHR